MNSAPQEIQKNQKSLRRTVRIACAISLALPVFGFIAVIAKFSYQTLGRVGMINAYDVFSYLFVRNEPPALFINLLLALLLCALFFREKWSSKISTLQIDPQRFIFKHSVSLIAILVLLLDVAGTYSVFLNYPLAGDEFAAVFQAQLFASGHIFLSIPEKLRPIADAMLPTFIAYNHQAQTWTSTYLPSYSAIRAVFTLAHLAAWTNPVLAGFSIVAAAACARNIFARKSLNNPNGRGENEKLAVSGAVLLLAGSAQFLVTSMTAFSMPAHLCLNLIWLALYARNDTRGHLLAPLVAFVAITLHQPIVHCLFVLPFLLRLVWQRRFGWCVYYAVIYSIALAACYFWWHWTMPPGTPGGTSLLGWPNLRVVIDQAASLAMIFSWQSLALSFAALVAILNWRRLPTIVKDCAWSCLLTFCFYFFDRVNQGNGWGDRYFYGTLGSLVILGTAGLLIIRDAYSEKIGEKKCVQLLVFGTLSSLLLLVPLRSVLAETFVSNFANCEQQLQSYPAGKVLVVDARNTWYGTDLVRNGPDFAQHPVIVSFQKIDSTNRAQTAVLKDAPVFDENSFVRFGIFPYNAMKVRLSSFPNHR